MHDRSDAPRGGVLLFMFLAFGWSWGLAFAAHSMTEIPWGVGLGFAYMAGPSIAAVICALIYDRGRFFRALGLTSNPFNLWLLLAFLTPVAMTVVALASTLLLSDRTLLALTEGFARALREAGKDPDALPIPLAQLAVIQLATAPFVAAIVNTIALILTEELGWRGWLWDRWKGFGFWKNALLTGLVWGVWHAPIIALYGHNYPGMPVSGPLLFIFWCVLFSPFMALVRERGGSVVHAAMAHGVLNGVAPVTLIFLSDNSMPWRGILGIGGFIALVLTLALAVLLHKPRTT